MPGRSSLALSLTVVLILTVGVVFLVGGDSRGTGRGAPTVAPDPRPGVEVATPEPLLSGTAATPEAAPVATTPTPAKIEREEVSSEYDAELAEGHWVEGTVRFPEGTPLDEEAFVVARGRSFEHGEYHRVPVAPNGSFRVAFSKRTRKGRLGLEGRYVYLEKSLRVDLKEDARSFVLEPRLGARMTGTVVPPEGAGVAAADLPGIHVWAENGGQSRNAELAEDLTYELSGIPVPASYSLQFDPDEFRPVRIRGLGLAPGETLVHDLTLLEGAVVAGRVLDGNGEPVAEAQVTIQQDPVQVAGQWFHRMATSAEDGSYRLAGLPPGKLELTAQRKGYRAAQETLEGVTETDRRLEQDLRIERGGRIAGFVRWADGSPAPGAKIQIRFEEERRVHEESWDVEDSGAFEITGLPQGEYRLDVSAVRTSEVEVKSELTGRVRKKKERTTLRGMADKVPTGTTDLALVLGEGFEINGVALDVDGAPVGRFRVQAARLVEREHGWIDRENEFSKRFDSADGGFTLSGMTAGKWEFRASAKDFGDSEPVVRTFPGSNEPLDLRLGRRGRIAGIVRSPSGAPVANARVETEVPHEQWMRSGPFGRTEADGSFVIDSLPPGRVKLVATAPGFASSAEKQVELGDGEDLNGLELFVQSACSITGQVIAADGRPDAGRHIQAWNMRVGDVLESRTDESGAFAFEGLTPGLYELTAESDSQDLATLLGEVPDESILALYARTEKVTLGEAESRQVTLRYEAQDTVRVVGRVLANGSPIPDLQIHIWSHEGTSRRSPEVRVSEDGTYETALLGGHRYQWTLMNSELGFQVSKAVEIPRVEEHVLDFDLEVGSISGRVLGPGGTPLEGIHLSARGERDGADSLNASSSTRSDESGRYEFTLLKAQQYTVTASEAPLYSRPGQSAKGTYANAMVTGVTVGPREAVQGIDLHMNAGGAIRGEVRVEDGGPVSDCWVQAFGTGGEPLNQGSAVDSQGRFTVEGLPVGDVVLRAIGRDLASRSLTVSIRGGETTQVEIVVVPAGSVSVSLYSAAGELEKGKVSVAGQPDARTYFLEERSWYIGPLPAGGYTLEVEVNGTERTREISIVGGERTEVEIRFD